MKKISSILAIAICLTASTGFSSTGTVEVEKATDIENTLYVTVEGAAAEEISAQLTANGIKKVRDGFTGALVQPGQRVRCISHHNARPLYCSFAIVGAAVQ